MSKRRRRQRSRTQITGGNGTAQSSQAELPATLPVSSEPSPESAVDEPESCFSEGTYLQERSTLIEIEQKSADQHDKAILTISMGGLALSITFIKDIAPHPLPGTLWSIGTSWSLFVASMLAILASFLTSQIACRRPRDLLDELYQYGTREAERKGNWWSSLTHWLNVVSYVLVFFAVGFLALFSWLNLR